VVNSSSFGRIFPEHAARARRLGPLIRFSFDPKTSGARLAQPLAPFRAVVASVTPQFDAAFFAHSPHLVLLARHGIGVDNVDLDAATRHGVLVTRVPGIVEREAMAEHAVALLLAVLRRLLPARDAVAAGRWQERANFVGGELRGRVVGIVGFGNVGRRTAEILSRGFGARVVACDPGVPAARLRAAGVQPCSLAALLARSDAVSLHCPLTPRTRRLIGPAALRRMRRGAILINTARGELLDERAVAAALRSGRLGGLGADVAAEEPAGRSHPFLRCPNAVLVPHVGAYTQEALRAMGDKMIADLEAVLRFRRVPRAVANPAVLRSAGLRLRRWR
jgi:phosphoglycerate dehydrogenase-like enzyme